MSKFKVGDMVRVKNTSFAKYKGKIEMLGKICEIKAIIEYEDRCHVEVWQQDKRDFWCFNEDDLELVLSYETIKVTKDNKNITVELQNGKKGKAHCEECDIYNEGIGVVIATARAYGVDLKDCADLVSKKSNDKDLTKLKSIIERAKKFLKDNEKTKYKITLSKFWNSKEIFGIHCDTEEKSNKLLKAFDRLGKKWSTGDNYLKLNAYGDFKSKTIYYNDNTYGYVNDCIGKIFEFNEVDLENE